MTTTKAVLLYTIVCVFTNHKMSDEWDNERHFDSVQFQGLKQMHHMYYLIATQLITFRSTEVMFTF